MPLFLSFGAVPERALPPLDFVQSAAVVPEFGDKLIVKGMNVDLLYRDFLPDDAREDLIAIMDGVLDNELSDYQLSYVGEELERAARLMGFVNARVYTEVSTFEPGRANLVLADLGRVVPAVDIDLEFLRENMKFAARERHYSSQTRDLLTALGDNPDLDVSKFLEEKNGTQGAVVEREQPLDAKIADYVTTYLPQAQSLAEADDKAEWLEAQAASYGSGYADSKLNGFLGGLTEGINSQLSLGFTTNYKFQPAGKILIPFYRGNFNTSFIQTGVTRSSQSRDIAHFGIGTRFYPGATEDGLGGWMFGFNAVLDQDLTRGHTRGSIGAEFMNDWLLLSANLYRRLSGWKLSPDYDWGYVEERPASGWDIRSKFFIPSYRSLALTADITHWIGNDISPFGDPDELVDDPWVYALGAEWTPVPAFTFSAKHALTNAHAHDTSVSVSFNIPLGMGFEDAFNPAAPVSGNSLESSQTMFINRDYTMPLQYRAKPGMYYITYLGADYDKHTFHIADGLKRDAAGVEVLVEPHTQCVVFDNDGEYVSDTGGKVTATVTASCVNRDTVTVSAGDTEAEFEIVIANLTFEYAAEPASIERYETSVITLSAGSDALSLVGETVTFSLDGTGGLSADTAEFYLNDDGEVVAEVVYTPDTSVAETVTVTVTASYAGVDYTTEIEAAVYGGADSLTVENALEGTETAAIVYENLKPGNEYTFTVDDITVATLSTDEDGTLEDGSDGSTVTVTADEDGKVTVYITAQDIDDGTTVLTVTDEDPYTEDITEEITVHSYVPVVEIPSEVSPCEEFTITISSLKAGTTIELADIEHTSGNEGTYTVDDDGTVTITLTADADYYYPGALTDISFTYYRNVQNPDYGSDEREDTEVSDVAIAEYVIEWSEDTAVAVLYVTASSFTYTVTGGTEGVAVTLSVDNDSVSFDGEDSVTLTFDSAGTASAALTVDDYSDDSVVTVTAAAFGDQTLTATLQSKNITAADVSAVVSAELIGENSAEGVAVTGTELEPATATNDPDTYGAVYSVTVSGVIEGTVLSDVTGVTDITGSAYSGEIAVSEDNGTFPVTCDDDLECEVTLYYGTPDYTMMGDSLSIAFTYALNGGEGNTAEFSNSDYSVASYTMALASEDGVMPKLLSEKITFSGGKPGSTVFFTLTQGDGEFDSTGVTLSSGSSASAVVDDDGQAVIYVGAVSPYSDDVYVRADFGEVFARTVSVNILSWIEQLYVGDFFRDVAAGYYGDSTKTDAYLTGRRFVYNSYKDSSGYVNTPGLELIGMKICGFSSDMYGKTVTQTSTNTNVAVNGDFEVEKYTRTQLNGATPSYCATYNPENCTVWADLEGTLLNVSGTVYCIDNGNWQASSSSELTTEPTTIQEYLTTSQDATVTISYGGESFTMGFHWRSTDSDGPPFVGYLYP